MNLQYVRNYVTILQEQKKQICFTLLKYIYYTLKNILIIKLSIKNDEIFL